ncbi:MAG: type II toxin-antitoxin system YafQ family toxin [Nitrospinae bacterium]|nr:type II toxin-antitoxin system YafQ family toxin [Nitrospinota bacterium]
MLIVTATNRFKRDLKLAVKRGKDLGKIEAIVNLLQARKPLPAKNSDHNLSGNWHSHRECHIEPDWLLLYRIDEDFLILERTGSHAGLFD